MNLDKETKKFFHSLFDQVFDWLNSMDKKLGIDIKENKNVIKCVATPFFL